MSINIFQWQEAGNKGGSEILKMMCSGISSFILLSISTEAIVEVQYISI